MSDVKIGLSGGKGGLPVEGYVVPNAARIREIKLTSGWFIDSIQVNYVDTDGSTHSLPGIGGNGDNEHHFVLEEDEYLVGVSGRSAKYLDSIRFHTNKRVSPTYGGEGGETEYSFLAPEGSEVVGFFGRADWYIDAIGIVVRPLPAAVESASEPVKDAKPASAKKKVASKAKAVTEVSASPAKAKKTKGATVVESAPAESTPTADDLKVIEGIGPKIADLLAQHGITTFAALAATPAPKVREMLLAAGQRFAISDPTTWPEQAKLAAAGDMEALQAFQAQLKGGRKPK